MPPRLIHKAIALLLLFLLPACAHTGETQVKPKRPHPDYGRIAVVVPECGGFKYDTPTKGWLSGMGMGTVRGIEVSGKAAEVKSSGSALLAALFSPFFAIVGGVHGAITAEPAWKVDACEEAVRQAIPDMNFRQELHDGIVNAMLARPSLSCVRLDGGAEYQGCADYSTLSAKGVDTVFEAHVLYCGLEGDWKQNRGMAVVLSVEVRLIRTSDGKEISSRTFKDYGEPKAFCDWAEDTAELKREVEASASYISDRAVKYLAEWDLF